MMVAGVDLREEVVVMAPAGSARRRSRGNELYFRESQKFRQPWLWAILLVSSVGPFLLFTWVLFEQLVTGRPVGDRPMPDAMAFGVWLGTGAFAAAMLWLFARAELLVEVCSDALHVQYKAFGIRKQLRYDELASWKATQYSPLGEYGGWGIRGMGKKKAYNVSGDRGVLLTFHDGATLLLGSQKATELEHAITRAASGG
jgi:hypothetical protein